MEAEVKPITVKQFPSDLWRQLKVRAAQEETTITALIADAVKLYLKKTA